jgi:hypothetical protein
MPADALVQLVLVGDHGHGVPAREALHAALQGAVAGIRHLRGHWDSVYIRCIQLDRDLDAVVPGTVSQLIHQEGGAFHAHLFHDLVESLNPLFGFARIKIHRSLGKVLVHISLIIR